MRADRRQAEYMFVNPEGKLVRQLACSAQLWAGYVPWVTVAAQVVEVYMYVVAEQITSLLLQ